jgi:hypothetical protein
MERRCEGLPHAMQQKLTIRPGKVGAAGHRCQIRLAFARLQGQTGQLPIDLVKAKVLLFAFRQFDIILRNLVAKAS